MSFSNLVRGRLQRLKHDERLLIARQARRAVSDLWPSSLLTLSKKKRSVLIAEYSQCSSVKECMIFARRHTKHGSIQILEEIESAIRVLADAQPVTMCEIGTFDGGTSLLFCKFLPTVEKMICVDLFVKNSRMLRVLSPAYRKLHFVNGSSYSDQTLEKIAQILDGRMIDVLFIDGDHRYEGVKRDFLSYRNFVRNGGLIMFHDIVPDRGTTSAWTGGVPKLWSKLSSLYPRDIFINDSEQDGFGIGILRYSNAVPIPDL